MTAPARRAARARSRSAISRSISRCRSVSGTVRIASRAADAHRRRREQVAEVADPILGRRRSAGDRGRWRGRPAPGVRVGSRPDANRSRSLVASSVGPSKRLTSWSMTRLIHTITSSSGRRRRRRQLALLQRQRFLDDALRGRRRARRPGFDVGAQLRWRRRCARRAPASAPGSRDAATKARNSLR